MTEPVPTTGRPGPSTGAARTGAARTGRPATAASSKIAVTGLGLTTMFGLVAGMAASAEPATPGATESAGDEIVMVGPAPTTATLPPVQATLPTTVPSAAPTSAAAPPTTARPRPEPLVLRPQPTVRPAPASQAPSGRTGGSR